jgi:DNA-binding transcriptional LysR family regulator
MERFFASHGVVVRPSMEMSSNETIKQAAMAGMGLAFLSAHTVGLELSIGRLVKLDVAGLPVVRQWHVVHLEDKRLSPAAQAFREFLLAEGAKQIRQAMDFALSRVRESSRARR